MCFVGVRTIISERTILVVGSMDPPPPPCLVNKLAMIVLQRIMTPSFVSLDMFALVVLYFFAV